MEEGGGEEHARPVVQVEDRGGEGANHVTAEIAWDNIQDIAGIFSPQKY